MDEYEPLTAAYQDALDDYLQTHNEQALFRASLLSHQFVESGLGPDDIIALHFEALEHGLARRSPREQARAVSDAHQFLLEVMIAYGVRYKEYLELKLRDSLREAEARAELEQQRAAEAERAERDKEEMLAGIAHELRTPITAAQGNLELAVRRLSKGQTDTLVPLLGSAREALDRLSRLTGDLVQISRGQAPQLELTPQDLREILAQACAWARPTASSKGVSLTLETQTVTMLPCNADALLSVFGNLLSNAVRYTPAGGSVRVRHGERDGKVWVEVRDSGIGISPEVQGRVFEKFYRGADARRLDNQGLGLGLTLVQQMVQAHQGTIELESASGQGTTFRVILPRGLEFDAGQEGARTHATGAG